MSTVTQLSRHLIRITLIDRQLVCHLLIGQIQPHEIQTQYPHLQRLMMSGKDGVSQIIKAFVTVVTLIALTGRLRVIKAALDDLVGLTRWAGDTIWPAQLTDGLITLDIIDEMLDIDLHGGLLSEIVEWAGVSIHHPQIHDPGIQYERVAI